MSQCNHGLYYEAMRSGRAYGYARFAEWDEDNKTFHARLYGMELWYYKPVNDLYISGWVNSGTTTRFIRDLCEHLCCGVNYSAEKGVPQISTRSTSVTIRKPDGDAWVWQPWGCGKAKS